VPVPIKLRVIPLVVLCLWKPEWFNQLNDGFLVALFVVRRSLSPSTQVGFLSNGALLDDGTNARHVEAINFRQERSDVGFGQLNRSPECGRERVVGVRRAISNEGDLKIREEDLLSCSRILSAKS
jgi:hypothetical protein